MYDDMDPTRERRFRDLARVSSIQRWLMIHDTDRPLCVCSRSSRTSSGKDEAEVRVSKGSGNRDEGLKEESAGLYNFAEPVTLLLPRLVTNWVNLSLSDVPEREREPARPRASALRGIGNRTRSEGREDSPARSSAVSLLSSGPSASRVV